MSRLPWGTLAFLSLCVFGFIGHEMWESHQQHTRFAAERTTLQPRLNALLARGYTTPAEELLNEFNKVHELNPYREMLTSIKDQKSRERSRQFEMQMQRQLYEETGDFIVEMALNELAEGDYEAARQSIAIFDKIPELEPVRAKIDAVEAEIKATQSGVH